MKQQFELDGDPNGVLMGNQGDVCVHLSQPIVYTKTGGTSNTGWMAASSDYVQPIVTSLIHIVETPATENDFSMFPGSEAPTTGLYVALLDASSLWVISGGDTVWSTIAKTAVP